MESKISKRFGHANFYLIFNTDDNSLEVRENHGHSNDHFELTKLINENVLHFVVGNIGPNAFDVIKQGSAKVYLVRKSTATEALTLLQNNSLESLEKPTLKRSIDNHDNNEHHHKHHQNDKFGQRR
jgi:predicted Fe-Mo cluster-binding NifX family protein